MKGYEIYKNFTKFIDQSLLKNFPSNEYYSLNFIKYDQV